MFYEELKHIRTCVQVYCEAINPCFDDKHLSDFEDLLMSQLAIPHITES